MKAVFMGTPDFAVPTLKKMIEAGIEVAAVVTQPDKVKGRGRKLVFSPVKEVAAAHEIPVYQPVRIRKDEEFKQQLREIAPDVIVVVAFGQIIPQDVLDIPRYGCINVHGSLLPKYRGAAPVQWAVLMGEPVAGVTTMMMDAGLDTGDMLLSAQTEVGPEDTSGTLGDRLSEIGADLLIETLKGIEAGTIERVKQDDSQTGMYASMLTKEMGCIDFTKSAAEIDRQIRGLDPWPGAYTHLNGKQLNIWKAVPCDGGTPEENGVEPGCILRAGKKDFEVQTGAGTLVIKEVQLEGRKRMDAGSFLRGSRLEAGAVFE